MPPLDEDREDIREENHDDQEAFNEADADENADADFDDEGDGDEDDRTSDSGDDDDDGEDEGRKPEGRQADVKRKGYGAIRAEAREAKAKADALELEIKALKAGSQQKQEPPETAEERQARLAKMQPGDRAEYLATETANFVQASMRQMQFNQFDTDDRRSFEALCDKSPAVAAIRDDVEKMVTDKRAQGQVVDRKTAAAFMLGDRILNGAGKARDKAQKRSDEQREKHNAKPVGGKSDQQRQGKKSGSEREQRKKRLSGVII